MSAKDTEHSLELDPEGAGLAAKEELRSDDQPDAPVGVAETKAQEEEFPEGGYGWVVVFCVFCVNAGTWGVSTTYGVYLSYYIANNYFSGGTPLRYAFVGGLCVGIAFITAPVTTFLIRTFGFRTPLVIGAIFLTVSQCLAGISHTFGAFLATQGVFFGLGLGLTMVPCTPLMAHWFNKRLSLAQGFANAGSGAGALILANTTRVSIDSLGIRWALIINGLVSLALVTPAIFLARGRKSLKAKSEPLKFHFLWHRGFVWVWVWSALAMMGYFIALFSLASFSTNGLGLSQTQGAALQSILAAGQMIGRPICGYSLDIGGRINSTIVIHLISGLSCFVIWLPARSFGVLVVFALVQGLVGGTLWASGPPVIRSVVGMQDLASALSIYYIITAAPVALAQAAAIALVDYSKSSLGRNGANAYLISICFCGSLTILSAFVLFGAKVYVQKSAKLLMKA